MGQISQLLGQTVHTAVHPTAGHWLRGLVSTTHAHHHHHHHLWVPLHGTTASITEKRQQQSFKWCVWLLQGAVHTEEHVDLLGKYRAATSGSSSVMSSRYIPSVPKCWLLFSNGRQTLKALHVLWSSHHFKWFAVTWSCGNTFLLWRRVSPSDGTSCIYMIREAAVTARVDVCYTFHLHTGGSHTLRFYQKELFWSQCLSGTF